MYKMPDYEYVHKELQKSGVTLKLLWLEYCERCRENGELPYQSTQFNKYYSDYAIKTNATMHLNHKPGEIMQVDWAGDTAAVIDTVTGEIIPAYLFVASLPYSGYAYAESFFSMNQECWTAAHVNAFKYFGGVTRILQCDNLKTGVISHGRTEVTGTGALQCDHHGHCHRRFPYVGDFRQGRRKHQHLLRLCEKPDFPRYYRKRDALWGKGVP